MKNYLNKITGKILEEKEYEEMCIREYTEIWEDEDNFIVEEYKEEGKSLKEFIEYMEKNDNDTDFEVIDNSIISKIAEMESKTKESINNLKLDENGNQAESKWFVMTTYTVDTDIIACETLKEAIKKYQLIINHLTKYDHATVTVAYGLFNKNTNESFMDINGNIHADYDSLDVEEIEELTKLYNL